MARGKPVVLATRTFPTRTEAMDYFGAMLARYEPGDKVSNKDAADLASLLERHPEYKEKVGNGIDHFEVQTADFSSQCFRVVRKDKTWARFSYHTCISPNVSRD